MIVDAVEMFGQYLADVHQGSRLCHGVVRAGDVVGFDVPTDQGLLQVAGADIDGVVVHGAEVQYVAVVAAYG
jgi:hypothetical protein